MYNGIVDNATETIEYPCGPYDQWIYQKGGHKSGLYARCCSQSAQHNRRSVSVTLAKRGDGGVASCPVNDNRLSSTQPLSEFYSAILLAVKPWKHRNDRSEVGAGCGWQCERSPYRLATRNATFCRYHTKISSSIVVVLPPVWVGRSRSTKSIEDSLAKWVEQIKDRRDRLDGTVLGASPWYEERKHSRKTIFHKEGRTNYKYLYEIYVEEEGLVSSVQYIYNK